jgi:hypothetical protein
LAEGGADDGVEGGQVASVASDGGEGGASGRVVALLVGVGEQGVELSPGALAAGRDGGGAGGEAGEALGAHREVGLERADHGLVGARSTAPHGHGGGQAAPSARVRLAVKSVA